MIIPLSLIEVFVENSLSYFSPLGWINVTFSSSDLISLLFVDNQIPDKLNPSDKPLALIIKEYLNNYFSGKSNHLNLPLANSKSPFYNLVYQQTQNIPYGAIKTYSELASAINQPTAQRAVAKALASNNKLIIIPCHRIIGKNTIGGFSAGIWRKKFLQALEKGLYNSVGLLSSKVHLVPHSNIWSELYEIEKEALLSVCNINPEQIQHVGSTSITGLHAKPVIDIMIGVEPGKELEYITKFERIGYTYKANFDPKEWHFFTKGLEDHITHHLHLCHYNSYFFKTHVAFREYLLSHPNDKDKYQKLKMDLQDKYADDRRSYTKAKDQFINSILEKCEI